MPFLITTEEVYDLTGLTEQKDSVRSLPFENRSISQHLPDLTRNPKDNSQCLLSRKFTSSSMHLNLNDTGSA